MVPPLPSLFSSVVPSSCFRCGKNSLSYCLLQVFSFLFPLFRLDSSPPPSTILPCLKHPTLSPQTDKLRFPSPQKKTPPPPFGLVPSSLCLGGFPPFLRLFFLQPTNWGSFYLSQGTMNFQTGNTCFFSHPPPHLSKPRLLAQSLPCNIVNLLCKVFSVLAPRCTSYVVTGNASLFFHSPSPSLPIS